jgi:YegS/Rv2252/BmrU family lipid kinase
LKSAALISPCDFVIVAAQRFITGEQAIMARRALLILNGKSRSGKAALSQVIEGLSWFDIEPVHKECGSREELSPLIAKEGVNTDMVIVGGGDGTLNAAAAGVTKLKRPLGILPLGTANDLARTLGLPTEIDAALRVIAEGKIRSIDVGLVNDLMFFNVASVGLSAELAQELTGDIKRRFGKLGYALAAIRVLARGRPFQAEISGSGRKVRSLTLQVAVGNGRYYGGGNIVEKTAAIDDGTLRLYSLEFVHAWRIILMFRSFRTGEHGAFNEVLMLRGTKFEIRTRRPRPVNADGEIITQTPAVFRVLPKAIEVIVP